MGYMNSQYRTVEPALIEHRQSYRHQVHIQRAAIREHGRTAKAGELIDLSIYGCRVARMAISVADSTTSLIPACFAA